DLDFISSALRMRRMTPSSSRCSIENKLSMGYRFLLVVWQNCIQYDTCECCKRHPFKIEGDVTNREIEMCLSYADDQYDGYDAQIPFGIKVDLGIDQHSESACCDDAEQQYGNTAHHRRRYALYDSGELADKTEYDCKNSSPADDPDTEYPRYCQHPDVFPVSRCRRSADYACEHRRHTITDQ